MSIGVCITTRHRPELLSKCLRLIAEGQLKPGHIVVSDDSIKPDMVEATKQVTQLFSNVTYVTGPHKGVCANRNNALKHLNDSTYVAFIDDDGMVSPQYLAVAQATYDALPESLRSRTILTGTRLGANGQGADTPHAKINFRCYFAPSNEPQIAGASYSIYPRPFFDQHPWDEEIFFGYEDAELSLRALSSGYSIVHVPQMQIVDGAYGKSTILEESGKVSAYGYHGEAARLYVGVKRYKDIEPSIAKLAVFLPLFFAQITYSLAKRRSLHLLPKLVAQSNVTHLFRFK